MISRMKSEALSVARVSQPGKMKVSYWTLVPSLSAALSCVLGYTSQAQAGDNLEDLAGTYEYLVSYRDTHNGALYRATGGPLSGLVLPYSFSDTEQYWGEYVCRQPGVSCAVSDYYDPQDYAIKARGGPGAILQTERVDVHNGTNIYDAATWQIAVVLGAVTNHFGNLLDLGAYQLASNQTQALSQIHNARNVPTGSRAATAGSLYLYNGTRIADPESAYAFRMTAPAWLAPDPLKDSRYAQLVAVGDLPGDNPLYTAGYVSWSDWKPITGDNAWAFLVGPLQAAYIHYVTAGGNRCVPFAEKAVQNAISVLGAFAAMQSAAGAVYYAPAGTLQNQGGTPVSQYFVSTENNLSLFAGLKILRTTLAEELVSDPALSLGERNRIVNMTALIDTMLSGGLLPDKRRTKGLREFLRAYAWRDGEFVTGGFADEPGLKGEWRPMLEPKAVDVNTWGVAALGSAQIDDWFGFGAAYHVWEGLKGWGAYGEGRTLWGVGYSDADSNGTTAEGKYLAGVLSGEWTAGAIIMVRNLIRHYQAIPPRVVEASQAQAFVSKLKADESAMIAGVQKLRYRQYIHTNLPGKPPDYANLIVEPLSPVRSEPYLYSSRRYLIPFGWYANPIPSTAASAWAILVADHYDPFGYGGKPN
jgi:hypothetical protein